MSEQEQVAEAAEQEESGSPEEQEDAGSEADAEGTEGEKKFDEAAAKAALKKKNNEAANLRKRLKDLEPLAKKAKELEDEQKSEGERLNEAKTTAEKAAADAQKEVARLRVALKLGLTETQAKRLVGETEEELEADADDLVASFEPAEEEEGAEEESQEDTDTKRRPKEKLRPGATPSAEEEETDPRKLAEGLPTYS